jgi:signal transduction histidine kinase
VVLADADGLVLADSQGDLLGQHLSGAEMASATLITVGGQLAGFLLLPAGTSVHDSLESQFLDQVNSSLLLAGLIAGVVALALGLVLARQLTAPLRALTRAVQHLAQGEPEGIGGGALPPPLPIRSQDEIGELTSAFNQMSRSLARQQTLRRNLMADVAHELRTPLSVMRGDLEALLDGVYEPTPEMLASLHEETLLLSRLVDDLRDLAQAEAGQLRLDRRPTDLADLLSSVVSSFEPQAEAGGQDLKLEVFSDLPSVDVDPQRIRQVVANLVSNALRHSLEAQDSGGKGQVTVSAASELDTVEVSVVDNGPGIPPEDLPHVFDRFWQGDRARVGSSGLGLAIAQELVRAHGGHIWAESTPGQGAEFSFVVPVQQEQN